MEVRMRERIDLAGRHTGVQMVVVEREWLKAHIRDAQAAILNEQNEQKTQCS